MMRPMCGSSSATRTWRGCSLVTRSISDEGRDVAAIATQLEEELGHVRARLHEHEQHGLLRKDRDDGHPLRMLEDGGHELAAARGAPELVGRADDRRNVRGDVLRIEIGDRMAVDEQTVATKHDRRLDPLSLPDGADEVANGGHHRSRSCAAKLGPKRSEVKQLARLKSLCAARILRSTFRRSFPLRSAMKPVLTLVLFGAAALVAAACEDPFAV